MRSIGRRTFMKICGATALAAAVPFKVRQVVAKPSVPSTDEEGWTPEKIAEATLTWCHYPGWTAWSCGKCHATMNVLCGAGFFCPRCEHYNVLPWSDHIIPDEHPNFGPKLATIRRGHELADRMVEAKRAFKVGDRVRVVRKMGDRYSLAQPLAGIVVESGGLLWTRYGWQLYEVQVGSQRLRCVQEDLEADKCFQSMT